MDATERVLDIADGLVAKLEIALAENVLLKRKLEIALRGLDKYGDEEMWSDSIGQNDRQLRDQIVWRPPENGYELARQIKAEIECSEGYLRSLMGVN